MRSGVRMEIVLKLDAGQKVYYHGHGPCVIGPIVRKVVCGTPANFYCFRLLDGGGAEFLVPANSSAVPMRALLLRREIPKLLRHLRPRVGPPRDLGSWQQRESLRSRVFASGSAFDLADMIESLTRSSGARKLALDESQALRRARELLVCEIAAVMDESKGAAGARLDSVLKSAKAR